MWQRLTLLLYGVVVATTVCRASAQAGRDILQADIVAEDQFTPIFQLVSNTSNPYFSASLISTFNSSLEMDTNPTFAEQWKNGQLETWLAGNTRWNLTMNFVGNATSGTTYTASLQTTPCPASSTDDAFTEATLYIPPVDNATVDMRGSFDISSGLGNFTVTYPFLIDYDSVEAVVVYSGFASTGSNFVACANMTPPPPDFPTDWSAMIEANFVDRGLTFTTRQLYSQTLNKARLDLTSYVDDRIAIADFTAGNLTFISPANATYPNGVCNYSAIPPFLSDATDASNVSLVDSAQFLRFEYDKVSYSPGHVSVRGIECEKWVRSDTFSRRNTSGTFNATFYFPVNQWQVGRADYHRLLKQVLVEGQLDDGDTFEAYFEYINFKPQNYTNDSASFDPCAFAPQGAGCNCSAAHIAALNGLQLASDPDGVSITSGTSEDGTGSGRIQTSNPHGFVSSQAGPYVGLVIIGMVAGGLFTVLGTWLYHHRFSGRAGHSRFQDGPM